MSALSDELARYLTVRRGLGYDLATAERILRRFVAFAESEGAEHISTALFQRWRERFGRAGRQTWAARLVAVRLFAQWLHGIDARHEVPPKALIPDRRRRPRPYIYRDEDVRRIVEAAAELPSIHGIRALTCSTLFGLIAVTGLRVSEALSLDADDLDAEAGVLTLRRGKLGKERLLPLSASTTARLTAYAKERDRLLGGRSKAFFVADRGERPHRLRGAIQLRRRLPGHRLAPRREVPTTRAWTAHPRPAPHLRGPHAGELVLPARGPGAGDDQAHDLSGTCRSGSHLLVHRSRPGIAGACLRTRRYFSGAGGAAMTTVTLPALVQQFFTERLGTQMAASPNTIAGYRDTFRLLLRFACERTGKVPTKLKIEDLDAERVGQFLAHVEASAATARAAATRGWRPYGRSSASWR